MITDEISDITSNEGKQKVASICNQLMINSNNKAKKKFTSKLTFASTKTLINSINSTSNVSTQATVVQSTKSSNKKSIVIETDNKSFEFSLKNNLLSARNENLNSINLNSAIPNANIADETKSKWIKNSHLNFNINKNSTGVTNKVTSSKALYQLENKLEKKKTSTGLGEYQTINMLMGKNKNTNPINSNNQNVNKTTISNGMPGAKIVNIDFQKIHYAGLNNKK